MIDKNGLYDILNPYLREKTAVRSGAFPPAGPLRKGEANMGYTKEDIIRIVREEDVKFIRMQFTDIFGQLKNVAITASQVERAVNNEIMLDGSSIEGFVRINESDQYLYPDLDSFVIFPWEPQHAKVARLICDVHNPDGTPFVGDPRGGAGAGAGESEGHGLRHLQRGPRGGVLPVPDR